MHNYTPHMNKIHHIKRYKFFFFNKLNKNEKKKYFFDTFFVIVLELALKFLCNKTFICTLNYKAHIAL